MLVDAVQRLTGGHEGALRARDVRLQALHAGDPALVVASLAPEELEHLRVRQDQEALVSQSLDDGVGDLLGLQHLAGRRDDARPEPLAIVRRGTRRAACPC